VTSGLRRTRSIGTEIRDGPGKVPARPTLEHPGGSRGADGDGSGDCGRGGCVHEALWAAAHRALGDGPGTQALVERLPGSMAGMSGGAAF
jgi:hypothetical protein